MKCMNCGAVVKAVDRCPDCGFDLAVQRKSFQLSNLYYNQGLDKAQIRDLSGAIDMLKRSLKFNKLNIPARNLLGLVYFEAGEAVAALSEWIISKNIMPEQNIATEYIQRLQSEPAKLDTINQTIKKYNTALKCCRDGNEDVAAIQLKKILVQNPKLIKGYHLLALIYLKREEYERARKILKKAMRIDKTNSTSLRFLKEVDEQTGKVTSLEPRGFFKPRKEEETVNDLPESMTVIQPPTFRESSVAATLLNIGLGLVVGGLVVWFLVVPALKQNINRSANEKIVEYSNTMASQEAQMSELKSQIEESNNTVTSAQQQITEANEKAAVYENLMKAYTAYAAENYEQAAKALEGMNTELLSVDARAVYDSIYQNIQTTMFNQLAREGQEAFDNSDWDTAIEKLSRAKEMNGDDYTVLNHLAHAYRYKGDAESAIANFQLIVDKFPGTRRATSAQGFIDRLKNGDTGDGNDTGGTGGNRDNKGTGGAGGNGEDPDTGGTGGNGDDPGTGGTGGNGDDPGAGGNGDGQGNGGSGTGEGNGGGQAPLAPTEE